jgi:hypothetical protein
LSLQFDPLDLGDEPVGTIIEERGNDAKHGVTEAADVQDVVAVRCLGRRAGVQVDADEVRLGSSDAAELMRRTGRLFPRLTSRDR